MPLTPFIRGKMSPLSFQRFFFHAIRPWVTKSIECSKEGAPSNIHGRQVLLIGCLHDQFIHLSVHGQGNGLLRHETPELVANILQDTGRSVGNVRVITALGSGVSHRSSNWWGAQTHSFADEVGGWVVEESFQDGHQWILILSQETKSDFTGAPERPYVW